MVEIVRQDRAVPIASGPNLLCCEKMCVAQVGHHQLGPGQVGSFQKGFAQVGSGQVNPPQVGPGQVGPPQLSVA